MKKILFLTAYPPTNITAGQNYTRLLLNDISTTNTVDVIYWDFYGHKVDLNNTINSVEGVKLTKFKKVCRTIIYLGLFPLFTVRFSWRKAKELNQIAKGYDLIYFDFSQVFIYSAIIKHPCKIMMCHDVISQKYSRKRFSFLYLWYIKFSERVLLNTAHYCFTFSEKDSEFLKQHLQINSSPVSFYLSDNLKKINLDQVAIQDYFILYGAWNRPENYEGLLWFIKKVVPHISVKIRVIGGGMPGSIKDLLESNKIDYLGFVNDPYPYIAASKALIAPLFQGAGVKVKAIESLALGTPVIGTNVAIEGIPKLKNSKSVYLCETVDEFVGVIQQLTITNEDKVSCQKEFLLKYSNLKFRNYINNL